MAEDESGTIHWLDLKLQKRGSRVVCALAKSQGIRHEAVMDEAAREELEAVLRRHAPRADGEGGDDQCGKGRNTQGHTSIIQDGDCQRLRELLHPWLLEGAVGAYVETVRRKIKPAAGANASKIADDERRLWLRLEIEGEFLRSCPWEVLAEEDLRIVRKMVTEDPRPLAMAGTLQVLMLVGEESQAQETARKLREDLRNTPGLWVAEPLVNGTWAEARKRLCDEGSNWHVALFIGHVTHGSYLQFADGSVSAGEFADACLGGSEHLRLVALLGCNTWDQIGQQLATGGLPAVVGMNFPVHFDVATLGLEGLLTELATSGRVDRAYERMRRSMGSEERGSAVLCLGTDETRLFEHDERLRILGDYLRALRDDLERMEIYSDDSRRKGSRKSLYQPRELREGGLERDRKDGDDTGDRQSPPRRGFPGPGMDGRLEQPRELRREKEDRLLQAIYVRDLRRCICGGAGMGKSTLLENLAYALANRFLKHPNIAPRRVPFLVHLPNWQDGQDLGQFIAEEGHKWGFGDQSTIEDLLRSGAAVLLLDGLDEVQPVDHRQKLVEWLDAQVVNEDNRHCAIILTSRPAALEHAGPRQFRAERRELEELNPEQVQSYVKAYFDGDTQAKEHGSRLAAKLKEPSPLRRLVANPLMLNLLCLLWQGRGQRRDDPLPASESELLAEAMPRIVERRKTLTPAEPYLAVLRALAWASWEQPQRRLSNREATEVILQTIKGDPLIEAELAGQKPSEVLEALVAGSGILRSGPQRTLGFAEETYREYLAGEHLATLADERVLELFGLHAWKPTWKRIWVFTSYHLWRQKPALIRRMVGWLLAEREAQRDDIEHSLLLLAGRLVAPSPDIQQEEPQEIIRNVIDQLLDVLRNRTEAREARRRVIEALGEIGTHTMVPALLNVLEELLPDGHLVWMAARALGDIGSEKAVAALLAVFQNRGEDRQVRCEAAWALGRIKGEAAVSALLAVFQNRAEDWQVRSSAAKALGEIGGNIVKNDPLEQFGLPGAGIAHDPGVHITYVRGDADGDCVARVSLVADIASWVEGRHRFLR